MPDPSNYDNREDWLEACIPTMIDEGREQDQAVAACMQMWRDRDKSEAVQVKPSDLVYQIHDGPIAACVDRAWSVLTVKSVNTERREIEGIASTPSVDRAGDIVDPMGAQFSLPMPLLHHHRSDQPVGHVVAAKATKDGISIKAKLAQIAEPGPVKDRVDAAWQEIKAGLVRGLSIGFKPLEYEALADGGLRFLKWAWFELSMVTIPAQQDAQISIIKSLDQDLLAASGTKDLPVKIAAALAAASRPGASGKSKTVNLKLKERTMSKTVAEHISALEAKRAAQAARVEALMAKSMEEGRTTDADEREELDGLQAEIDSIDEDLKRFRKHEQSMQASAKPVVAKSTDDASAARAGQIRVTGPQLPQASPSLASSSASALPRAISSGRRTSQSIPTIRGSRPS